MLVLSRKKNERIVINNNIIVMVVDIRGDKVRLGIEAPREVTVHRREVYEAIKRGEVAKAQNALEKAIGQTPRIIDEEDGSYENQTPQAPTPNQGSGYRGTSTPPNEFGM